MHSRNALAAVALLIAVAPVLLACQKSADAPASAATKATDGTATGAAAPATAPAAPPLAGTAWQLVELQSMDDSQGVRRPADPSRYTMRLEADGRVTMTLDCNNATGDWKAEAAASDPASGSFEFGALAATAALCPPPTLGEDVSAQAQYVRGYLIKDGRLNLSLMADGGIQVWEPLVEPSTSR
jgi:heat shock protein HslJ